MPGFRLKWQVPLYPLLALLVPFTLYLFTTARDIYWFDSAEFVVITRSFGLAHPPGYPLLLNILHLFSLIPLFALPFRLNLVSGMFAALSAFFVFLTAHQLTKNRFTALLGALIWAGGYELWRQATAIEVYTLQTLLVSILFYTTLRYYELGSPQDFLLFAFFFGLGLANHLFVIFLLPAFLILLYLRIRYGSNPRILVLSVAFLFLGPLVYLTLLFRNQNPPSWAGINNLADLFEYLSGRIFRYRLFAGARRYLLTQIKDLPGILFQQFTIFWLIFPPGILYLVKKNRPVLFTIFALSFLTILPTLTYNIPDKEGYFLPAYFGFVLIITCGISYPGKYSKIPVRPLLALIWVVTIAIFYTRQNRSHFHGLTDLVRAVRKELPADAILLTDDYSLFHGVNYLNLISAPEEKITVISHYHLVFPWYLKQLETEIPVPKSAFELARNLWDQPVRLSDTRFGEMAKTTSEQIALTLIQALVDRKVHYFPQDFTTFLENWHSYRLKLRGLTYELRPVTDTTFEPDFPLHFPGPERYNTKKHFDLLTQDLCRRFAATVNRRGMLKYAKGDPDGAISDFNLSLKYYPDYPSAIENKGMVFAFEGKADSARFYLNRFLQIAPGSPETDKVKSILYRLGN